ncbi:GDSL family lysophospholipase PlaA [Legionella cardiaca]|uniref:SGNH/GDSL hydrolase family protein n=1 Tax=Legionella cardiaca TaxID=1071983 RepID=A0ABY8ASK1_9GAMM|nr:SGNH/GDSL hydrolase family protein [Legionella cardiaca]WED43654.1 SGNH/GDSL hydrolase family protein [Legionella cardiaca]
MKILFTVVILFFSGLVAAKPLNNIVVFGDSLSDNGNLYEYMHQKLPQSPPYYQGRFTNGPVWVERLAADYFPHKTSEHLFDYAFGGAGISETPDDDVLFTLKKEIDTYFLAHQEKADKDSLFIIWIGANNYLGIPDNPEQVLNEVNLGITHGLQRLADAGAKHILIVNLPDLGKTPIATAFDAQDKLSYFANQHNELLTASLENLKQSYPEVQWLYFDVNQTLNDLIIHPEKYGFDNISDTCYEAMAEKPSNRLVLHMATKLKLKEETEKDACEGFLFFDPVHPTAPAHQIMAEHAKNFLDASGVKFD